MRRKGFDIIPYLKSPHSGSSVEYDGENNLVDSADPQNKFSLIEGVPIMISDAAVDADNHVAHYQMDAKYYDYFREKPKSWQRESERLHNSIIKLSNLDKVKSVVDVGSGGGWLVDYLIKNTESIVIPFDISIDNIKKIKILYPSERNNPVVGDAMNFPFKNECLDRIFAIEIIEHVPQPQKFVSNLLQALKKDGSLIISTPYNEKIESSLCIHCNKPTPHNAHLHSFDERKLLRLLPDTGYNVFMKKCNSTILLKLRLHILLWFLPYKVWNVIDQILIRLTGKAERIIMQITKK